MSQNVPEATSQGFLQVRREGTRDVQRRLEAIRAIKQGMMQEHSTGRARLVAAEAST